MQNCLVAKKDCSIFATKFYYVLAMRTSAIETDLRKACEEKMVGGLEEK
jgi:hypothetical protein